jgi:hypothetical protein
MAPSIQRKLSERYTVKNCDHDSLSELSFNRTVEMTRDEFKLRHHCRLNPDVRKNPSSSPFLLRRERRLGASGRILATKLGAAWHPE